MLWWEIILTIAGCIAVVTFVSLYALFVLSSHISEEEEKARAIAKEKESKDDNRQR